MPLVFAAIAPHTPVLLPSVGKAHLKKLKKTLGAFHLLEQTLVEACPETILVFSPHGRVESDHFTIELRDTYEPDLKDFGVFEVPLEFRSDLKLASAIKEQAEDRGLPLMLRTEAGLDYGTVVPLTYLAPRLTPATILPIFPSLLPLKTHAAFGAMLQEVILHTERRVAVLCSVDLSHRLSRSSPAGYSPFGKKFDEKILALLQEQKQNAFATFEPQLAEKAAQCALPALTILAGLLDGIHVVPELLSYESPFGIGCLAARYHLG